MVDEWARGVLGVGAQHIHRIMRAMRIPFNHPAHSFTPTGLPPMPSGNGRRLEHYRCIKCGLSGNKDATGTYLHLDYCRKDPALIRQCRLPPETLATLSVIVTGGSATCGPVAKLAVYAGAMQEDEGIWVLGHGGDLVPLRATEFRPIRKRTRA